MLTQEEIQHFNQVDPTLLQSRRFLVFDPNISELIKGYFNQPLTTLRRYIALAETEGVGGWGPNAIYEIKQAVDTILNRLSVYERLVPYQFLLSHLMRVGNYTPEQAQKIQNRIKLMICYDKITLSPAEREILTENFWSGLELHLINAVCDNVKGWKAQILTREEKLVQTMMAPTTSQQRKSWRNLWGLI